MPVSHEVQCPMPGTFYRRSSPDAPPYKEEGDRVEPGDVLGLVEVMKQFSEVTAEVSGVITAFLAPDGDPVDPGQTLATIQVD